MVLQEVQVVEQQEEPEQEVMVHQVKEIMVDQLPITQAVAVAAVVQVLSVAVWGHLQVAQVVVMELHHQYQELQSHMLVEVVEEHMLQALLVQQDLEEEEPEVQAVLLALLAL
jgi:cell division FtsZ-interacting protein ZapD